MPGFTFRVSQDVHHCLTAVRSLLPDPADIIHGCVLQAQQWIYFGRLDDFARPVEPLLSTVLSLGGALPRHNPRILPSPLAGEAMYFLAAAMVQISDVTCHHLF